MARYDEDATRVALMATIAAGSLDAKPLRVVCEGDQNIIGHGVVALMPPQISLVDEQPSEAWVIWRSVWTLNLYVALSVAGSAERAHSKLGAFTLAVLDALHDDRRLGGTVKGITPAEDVGEAGVYTIGVRKFLTRSLAFAIHH